MESPTEFMDPIRSEFDFIVIGTGPAGQRAAIQAAKLGKRTLVIEKQVAVGGVALATGTIPSKTLREAVMHLGGLRQRGLYGPNYRVKQNITLEDLTFRVNSVLHNEIEVIDDQLRRNGVDVAHGSASFVNKNTILISTSDSEREVTAKKFLIAVGSKPATSSLVPIDGHRIYDTDVLFRMKQLPRTMIIVGAGIIGIEYAGIFAGLGVKVTLIDMHSQLLDFVDRELVDGLMYHMRERGVAFRLEEHVTEVRMDKGVVAKTGSGKTIVGDCLLYCVGRQGAVDELGLENIGVQSDSRGRIAVDEHFRTSAPNVYAAGDVIGFPALAATSMEQGRMAALSAFKMPNENAGNVIPYGIYTIPEISMVGATEKELTAESIPYEYGIAKFAETARGQIIGEDQGRLKILVHSENREVLGVHIIGEGATELIHIGQMLIGLDAPLDYLVNNVFNYPTLAECYKIAALDVYNKLADVRRNKSAA
jgi:NAD(P) transhydrogenase